MRVEAALRPFEMFNPANRKHREYYKQFMEQGTWGYCPVRFTMEEDFGNLAATIQRKLTEYYVGKEFK